MVKVYQNEKDCCGCGICSTVCPKYAISMKSDKNGFIYPEVNSDVCIECGVCKKACSFYKRKNESLYEISSECYAACNMNQKELNKSTSGGVFSAIAHSFIEQGGVVVGACMKFENNNVHVFHTVIDSIDELEELQGSKYVQSNMWECLTVLERLLKEGRMVLASGTPCQIDALKGKFEKYLNTQLFTIDIICHGVPNQKLLEDFLEEYQRRHRLKVKKIVFRDKENGWGHKGSIITKDNKVVPFSRQEFSYYNYFINGEINRESCYSCPYACLERVGDITIGDYWGIRKQDPKLLAENGGPFDFNQGISCLLVNNVRGNELLSMFGNNIKREPIEIRHVKEINTQLREPVKHTEKRKKIFTLYGKKGYFAVEKMFQKQLFCRKIKGIIKVFIKR